jgi:hypothetical protein
LELFLLLLDELLLSLDDLVLLNREVELIVDFVPFVDLPLLPHLLDLVFGVFLHLIGAFFDRLL